MKKLVLIFLLLLSIPAYSQGIKKGILFQPPEYERGYKDWVISLPSNTYSSTFTKLLGIQSGTFAFMDIPESESYYAGTGLSLTSNTFSVINVLPAGSSYQTLYHNGTAWTANNVLQIMGDNIVVGVNNTISYSIYSDNVGCSSILGGRDNQLIKGTLTPLYYNVISGGRYNTITSAVSGGQFNNIGGGRNNSITSYDYSNIGGGYYNAISSGLSVISGGYRNTISGAYSSIAGGIYLKLGSGSFGFRGMINTPSSQLDLSAETNTAHFANVNFKQHHGTTTFANLSGSGTAVLAIDANGLLSRGSASSYYAGTGLSLNSGTFTNTSPGITYYAGTGLSLTSNTFTNTMSLPSGSQYQTLYHNGTNWTATNVIRAGIGASNYSVAMGNANNDVGSGEGNIISGGISNVISGQWSNISGGAFNSISSNYSTVSGLYNSATGTAANVSGVQLKVGAYSFGYRGALNGELTGEVDVSDEPNTAHFVDVNFKQHDGFTQFLSLSGDGSAFVSVDANGVISRGSATISADGMVTGAEFISTGGLNQQLNIFRQNMTTISAGFADSDSQILALNSNTLSISNGNSITLTQYLDNTDNQLLSLSSTTLSINNGNYVNLSPFLDNTDSQYLSLSSNTLTISSGNSVDLSEYVNPSYTFIDPLFNNSNTITIAQASITSSGYLTALDWATFYGKQDAITAVSPLQLNSGTLTIDLTGLVDTDDQTLALNSNTLSISNGNSVDLMQYLDNTDSQTLALSSGTLSISNSNSVDLTAKFYSQSSSTFNCSNGDFFLTELDESATITMTNMIKGINYSILIKNSDPANAITITLPQTNDVAETSSIILPPLKLVEMAVIYTGSIRIWAISNNLTYSL